MNTFTLGACFQHELHTGPHLLPDFAFQMKARQSKTQGLGACFQHELHMGPYFMTFAPRLHREIPWVPEVLFLGVGVLCPTL